MEKKFDYRVHVRNSKTGEVEKTQPYSIKFIGGRQVIYRNGIAYNPNGTEIETKESIKRKAEIRNEEKLIAAEQEYKLAAKKAQKAEEEMLLVEIVRDEDEKSLKELKGKNDKESKELKESLGEAIKRASYDITLKAKEFKKLKEICEEKGKAYLELAPAKETEEKGQE